MDADFFEDDNHDLWFFFGMNIVVRESTGEHARPVTRTSLVSEDGRETLAKVNEKMGKLGLDVDIDRVTKRRRERKDQQIENRSKLPQGHLDLLESGRLDNADAHIIQVACRGLNDY